MNIFTKQSIRDANKRILTERYLREKGYIIEEEILDILNEELSSRQKELVKEIKSGIPNRYLLNERVSYFQKKTFLNKIIKGDFRKEIMDLIKKVEKKTPSSLKEEVEKKAKLSKLKKDFSELKRIEDKMYSMTLSDVKEDPKEFKSLLKKHKEIIRRNKNNITALLKIAGIFGLVTSKFLIIKGSEVEVKNALEDGFNTLIDNI